MSTLSVDIMSAHADDLESVVGLISWVPQGKIDADTSAGYPTHSGIPILSLPVEKADLREALLIGQTIGRSSGVSVPAEVLPGELICKDRIIRRESALKEPEQAKVYQNARKVSIGVAKLAAKDGKMVVWRPTGYNCDHALIIEEGD